MSERIYVTFTDKQAEKIEDLVGDLGNSKPDVVANITSMWLWEEQKFTE